jgi:hypothetical protein
MIHPRGWPPLRCICPPGSNTSSPSKPNSSNWALVNVRK